MPPSRYKAAPNQRSGADRGGASHDPEAGSNEPSPARNRKGNKPSGSAPANEKAAAYGVTVGGGARRVTHSRGSRNRAVLVDWLLDVAEEFALRGETLFLAVDLLDRHLSCTDEATAWLQLLGMACIWTASKMEEVFGPSGQDMINLTEGLYTKAQLCHMERHMLQTIKHSVLGSPNVYMFLATLLHVSEAEQTHGSPPSGTACALCYWDACDQHAAAISQRSVTCGLGQSNGSKASRSSNSLGSCASSGTQVMDGSFVPGCPPGACFCAGSAPARTAMLLPPSHQPAAALGGRPAPDHHHPGGSNLLLDVLQQQQQPHQLQQEDGHGRPQLLQWLMSRSAIVDPVSVTSSCSNVIINSSSTIIASPGFHTLQGGATDIQSPQGCNLGPGFSHMLRHLSHDEEPTNPGYPAGLHCEEVEDARMMSEKISQQQCRTFLSYMARLMAEACLLNHTLLQQFLPSQVAAACVMVSRSMVGLPAWSPILALHSGLEGPQAIAACVVAVADAYACARQDVSLAALGQRYGPRRMNVIALEPSTAALELVDTCRNIAATLSASGGSSSNSHPSPHARDAAVTAAAAAALSPSPYGTSPTGPTNAQAWAANGGGGAGTGVDHAGEMAARQQKRARDCDAPSGFPLARPFHDDVGCGSVPGEDLGHTFSSIEMQLQQCHLGGRGPSNERQRGSSNGSRYAMPDGAGTTAAHSGFAGVPTGRGGGAPSSVPAPSAAWPFAGYDGTVPAWPLVADEERWGNAANAAPPAWPLARDSGPSALPVVLRYLDSTLDSSGPSLDHALDSTMMTMRHPYHPHPHQPAHYQPQPVPTATLAGKTSTCSKSVSIPKPPYPTLPYGDHALGGQAHHAAHHSLGPCGSMGGGDGGVARAGGCEDKDMWMMHNGYSPVSALGLHLHGSHASTTACSHDSMDPTLELMQTWLSRGMTTQVGVSRFAPPTVPSSSRTGGGGGGAQQASEAFKGLERTSEDSGMADPGSGVLLHDCHMLAGETGHEGASPVPRRGPTSPQEGPHQPQGATTAP